MYFLDSENTKRKKIHVELSYFGVLLADEFSFIVISIFFPLIMYMYSSSD